MGSRGLNLSQLYMSVNSVNTGELLAHCRPLFGGFITLLKGTSCAEGVLASPPSTRRPPPHVSQIQEYMMFYVCIYVCDAFTSSLRLITVAEISVLGSFLSLFRGAEGRRVGKPQSRLLLFVFARHFPSPLQPTCFEQWKRWQR